MAQNINRSEIKEDHGYGTRYYKLLPKKILGNLCQEADEDSFGWILITVFFKITDILDVLQLNDICKSALGPLSGLLWDLSQ